jgi:hypothetical protein
MRKCPKCEKTYPDEAKICRTCGAILEPCKLPEIAPREKPKSEPELITMADVVDDRSNEEALTANDSQKNLPNWICPSCKKTVPGNFDVCWNCFTTREGEFDPDFAETITRADIAEDQVDEEEFLIDDAEEINLEDNDKKISPKQVNRTCCPRCGSDKIIRDAHPIDHGDHNISDNLTLVVYGNPEALIFKDRLSGTLSADICGNCGHVEFRVDNPGELYEHYRKSRS